MLQIKRWFVTCVGRNTLDLVFLVPCWLRLWLATGSMLSSPGLQKELKEPSLSQDAAMEAEISDRFGIYPVESRICLATGFTLRCFCCCWFYFSNQIFVCSSWELAWEFPLTAGTSRWSDLVFAQVQGSPVKVFGNYISIWVQQQLRECRNCALCFAWFFLGIPVCMLFIWLLCSLSFKHLNVSAAAWVISDVTSVLGKMQSWSEDDRVFFSLAAAVTVAGGSRACASWFGLESKVCCPRAVC